MRLFVLFAFLITMTFGAVIQSDHDGHQQKTDENVNERANEVNVAHDEHKLPDLNARTDQQERVLGFNAGAKLGPLKVGASFKFTDPYASKGRRNRYDDNDEDDDEDEDLEYARWKQMRRSRSRYSNSPRSYNENVHRDGRRQGRRRSNSMDDMHHVDMNPGLVRRRTSSISDHDDDDNYSRRSSLRRPTSVIHDDDDDDDDDHGWEQHH